VERYPTQLFKAFTPTVTRESFAQVMECEGRYKTDEAISDNEKLRAEIPGGHR